MAAAKKLTAPRSFQKKRDKLQLAEFYELGEKLLGSKGSGELTKACATKLRLPSRNQHVGHHRADRESDDGEVSFHA